MRAACFILVAVLFVHLHCGGTCLEDSFSGNSGAAGAAPELPCHQPNPNSSKIPAAPHDITGPCTQGPTIKAKLIFSPPILPVAEDSFDLDQPFSLTGDITLVHLTSPSVPLAVLRI